jgi:hypothetical protein
MKRLSLVTAAVAVIALVATGWVLWRPAAGDRAGAPAGTAPHFSSASPPAPSPQTVPPPRRPWGPKPGQAWQWQLTTPVDLDVDVEIYDIDGFENSAATVRTLHDRGRRVICYIEVGAAGDFRPDYGSYPESILGKPNGWPGERWVDIRRTDLLEPILAKRFDMCRDKGFDAVEPDLMENYAADTGFPVTAAQQLTFNRLVARLAHDRGMGVALKNGAELVDELVSDVDFAVVEECAEFDECDAYLPFIRAGKAVLHVEYKLAKAEFCAEARANRFSSMRKSLDLDAPRQPC